MAEALIRGLIGCGAARADAIAVSDPSPERRAALASRHHVAVHAGNAEVVRDADVLVLAVKPQSLATVLPELAPFRGLVVTLLAGVRCSSIEHACAARVVRAMPNMPALVGAGVTAIAGGARATDADGDVAEELFAAVGRVVRLDESALDAVTGLSGSGPAYVMLVIEALTEGGVRMGLSKDVALTLAAHTVLGSARLLLETGDAPEALRRRVSSPGGTTMEGLERLDAARVREAFIDAIRAATERAAELGR